MFIERESNPYIPWIGLDAKGGERTVAAQRMEVSNADEAAVHGFASNDRFFRFSAQSRCFDLEEKSGNCEACHAQ